MHAKRARIRDHRASGRGKLRLHLARNIRVERRENNLRRALGLSRRHRHICNVLRQLRVQLPAHRVSIPLSTGTVARRQPRHFKPRVALKKLNKSLTDHSGRAKDADLVSLLHIGCWNFTVGHAKFSP